MMLHEHRTPLLSLLLYSISTRAAINVVSNIPAQTFTGIGGSGAWWPNDLYSFPEPVRQNLSNLLFSQDLNVGLGLTSYRYNIGAGGVNVSDPTRAPQTFYVSEGVYDWNQDQAGMYFLRGASSNGVPGLTAFANSAPAALTAGGASCNSQFVNGSGDAYGAYLADVILHFKSQGINISYVSPMNEPDNNFGPSPCGQEGMLVEPNQRAEVVNGLYDALQSRGLSSVGILADESTSLVNANKNYAAWLPSVASKVAALVHHTYDFPNDANYTSFAENTRKSFPDKVTWMSEVCCTLGEPDGTGIGWSQGYDPTINNALVFSQMMLQSFLIGNEPHYDFWTLVSDQLGCDPTTNFSCATTANGNGWNDGLIYYDPSYKTNGNYNIYIKKQYYTLKHFGHFVRPGSQRRPINGPDASKFSMAVFNPSTNSYSVLAMNPGNNDTTLSLTFPKRVCAKKAYRTSATEDFVQVKAASAIGATWQLPLKAMSLTTYLFDGRC